MADNGNLEVKGGDRIISRQGKGHASYGFNVASYDCTRELVIDQVLNYSTYIGGNASDFARNIAVDSTGGAYETGRDKTSRPVLVLSPVVLSATELPQVICLLL